MPLRDLGPYLEWVARESPPIETQQVVRHFLVEISDEPWRWPSVPVREMSDQPLSEFRTAELPGDDDPSVAIWYRHFYATGDVDILAVTTL